MSDESREIQKLDAEQLDEFFEEMVSSLSDFPFNFDEVWPLIGYSTKGNAKEGLLTAGLVEGTDFKFFMSSNKNSKRGRPSEKIMLTAEAIEKLKRRTKSRKLRPHESVYRDILAKQLDGVIEVVTEAGVIDILTSTELIEVKDAKCWKTGIGQLMVYSHYYPSHRRRLHLLGTCHDSFLAIVQKHCNNKRRNIKLTWESY